MRIKKTSAAKSTYSFDNSENNLPFLDKLTKFKYIEFVIPVTYLIVLLIISISEHKIGNYGVESDFYWSYYNSAKEFLKGNIEIDSYRGPVYPMILGIFGFIFNNDFFNAGMYLNIICASVVLFLVHKTINLFSSKAVGTVVVLLVATNSQFIKYSYSVGTDMLFIVFFMSAIYFILKGESGNKNYIFAGIFSGLAYLTRYTAVSLVLLFCLLIISRLYQNRKNKVKIFNKDIIHSSILYFIPFLVFFFAWGLFCLSQKGVFFYNNNFYNTAIMVYKPSNIPNNIWNELNQSSFNSFFDVMSKDFGQFIQKVFIDNLFSYFFKDMEMLVPVYFGVIISAGLIISIMFFKKLKTKERLWFILNLIFYLQIILTFYSERFTLPILPFYCYLAVKLFTFYPIRKFNAKIFKGRLITIILLVIVSINFSYAYKYISIDIVAGPTEILEIKGWLEKNYKEPVEGKILASYKPHISYYLKTKHEQILINITRSQNDTKTNMKNNLAIIKPDFLYLSTRELTMQDVPQDKLSEFYLKTLPAFIPELKVITYTINPLTCLYKYNYK